MGDVPEERAIAVSEGLPVVAVEVFDIEEVAIAPPDLVEDLGPLLRRHAVDGEIGGGDRLLAVLALGRGVVEVERRPLLHQHLRAVGRQGVAADLLGQRRLLAIGDGVDPQLGLRFRIAAIVNRPSAGVDQVPLDGRRRPVISAGSGTRTTRSARPSKSIVIGSLALGGPASSPLPLSFLFFLRLVPFLRRRAVLTSSLSGGNGFLHVLAQGQGIDARRPIADEVPLEVADLGRTRDRSDSKGSCRRGPRQDRTRRTSRQ